MMLAPATQLHASAVRVVGQGLLSPANSAYHCPRLFYRTFHCCILLSSPKRRQRWRAGALLSAQALSQWAAQELAAQQWLMAGLADSVGTGWQAPVAAQRAAAAWASASAVGQPSSQAALVVGSLVSALQPSCFDSACQQEKDTLLIARCTCWPSCLAARSASCAIPPLRVCCLLYGWWLRLHHSAGPVPCTCSLAVPLLMLVAAVAYLLRPPPQGSLDDGTLFEDRKTGALLTWCPLLVYDIWLQPPM